MEVRSLSIPDVKLITPKRFGDQRGYFEQTYHRGEYQKHGIDAQFVQDNFSKSTRGVLRGLHYQITVPQAKLVSVVYGEVFDVAVDLRRSSPHFGQWVGDVLSAENGRQLYVPRGFAHGFFVLSEEVGFYYKCDAFYSPENERSLLWSDSEIGINWPKNISPKLSSKDLEAPTFSHLTAEDLFD